MRKDYLTEKEIEELEELEARSQDVYYAPNLGFIDTLDNEDYGLSSAEQGFLLGYMDA